MLAAYLRLARPTQWAKSAFVLVGPVYSMALSSAENRWAVLGAMLAFSLASSVCYVHNDIQDRDQDRAHPRKRARPIAAGQVSVAAARGFGTILGILAVLVLFLIPGGREHSWRREIVSACVALYVINTVFYSALLKRRMVADVISLSLGFVLRVLGGCAAVYVVPSSWLLNVTFFLSMFLAFGKRLGERRTMGEGASSARSVQARYTDDILRMAVVVTGVATLLTYAGYVQAQEHLYTRGFNLLWVTMLPATYGLLRAIFRVETGAYDDPTELAFRDRPFQIAAACFCALTLALIYLFRLGGWAEVGWPLTLPAGT